ncbi:MAG: hypothetical protein A3J29_06210 [Acidobacteria bacterium RIFCSPLOWO2_12_FULL_67_14b]|nr:MAG: hypothetical protein A3J29_06210 [Acidobacteria bacterium RIFCSPLOWO2_12_FULL_67_14b]
MVTVVLFVNSTRVSPCSIDASALAAPETAAVDPSSCIWARVVVTDEIDAVADVWSLEIVPRCVLDARTVDTVTAPVNVRVACCQI